MRCLSFLACSSQLLLGACSEVSAGCRVGADCASGVCRGDGTCAPADAGGGAGGGDGDGGGGLGGGAQGDAGSPDGVADGGMSTGCLPNRDGVVQRSEIVLRPGLRAIFLTSGAATFDTAGAAQADGGRFWDVSRELTGDTSRLVETRPLQGTWFEAEFPDAGYYTELGQGTAFWPSLAHWTTGCTCREWSAPPTTSSQPASATCRG